jgi:hypothetical protein
MNRRKVLLVGFVAATVLLMACQSSTSNTHTADPAGAPKAIENYLQARVKADVNQMIALSCAAWESQAKVEASTFQSLKAEIEGMTCSVSGSEGSNAFVACQGAIKTTYNGESRERDLAQQQFKLAHEGGDWRMCGYK